MERPPKRILFVEHVTHRAMEVGVYPMKVKDMIKENNRLREQMTPGNRSYFEDMILALRDSRIDAIRTEQLLLEAAGKLLRAQAKGKTARQVFGGDPEHYFRRVIEAAPARPERGKASRYAMTSWTALTLLFGVLGIAGLVAEWTGNPAGPFGRISLFTLIAVGLGSVAGMELLMKWLASLSEDDVPKVGAFNLKALGGYIGIAVVIVVGGFFLRRLFPVFTLSPWVCLLLFVCGLALLKPLFLRNRK